MSTTHKRVISGDVVGTEITTGYTVPSAVVFIIHRLTFTNYHASANATLDVYLVPSGASFADRYKISDDKIVLNSRTFICYEAEGHALNAGDKIQYITNTSTALTGFCSGVEITA